MQNTIFKRYIVDLYGDAGSGQYATVRNDGTVETPSFYLNDVDTINSIATAVTANATFLSSNLSNNNQINYVEMIGSNLADDILRHPATAMIFDPDPRYAYDGILSSSNALQSGDCTYILEHVQYPSLWKIGFTNDLYRRTQELYNENNKLPVKLIAFFRTKKNVELEAYLHMAFASCRKTGEWFQFQPVERWINFYKSEVKIETEPEAIQTNGIVEQYVW